MSDTTLEKIAKLLRMAEKASTAEESAAFQEKAQAIATKSAIDIEIAAAHNIAGARKPVLTHTSVKLGERGKRGLYTYVELFCQIAWNNNVKLAVSSNSTTVYLYGFDTDIEIVTALYESLIVQMVKESDAFLRSGEYKTETVYRPATERYNSRTGEWEWKESAYVPVHGRTARLSFQSGFATTIGSRLRKARKDAEQAAKDAEQHMHHAETPEAAAEAAGSDSVALVLVRKAEAVSEYYNKVSGVGRRSYKGGRNASYSSTASSAGREAGHRARIGATKAIGGHRTQVGA